MDVGAILESDGVVVGFGFADFHDVGHAGAASFFDGESESGIGGSVFGIEEILEFFLGGGCEFDHGGVVVCWGQAMDGTEGLLVFYRVEAMFLGGFLGMICGGCGWLCFRMSFERLRSRRF